MKKLLFICLVLTSCNDLFIPEKDYKITITKSEESTNKQFGKYFYETSCTNNYRGNLNFWSDTLYSIGQEVKLVVE